MTTLILVTILSLFCFTLTDCTNNDKANRDSQKKNTIPIDSSLRLRTDSFISAVNHNGQLGLYIYDITADKEVYAYNADSLMRPASCMKLLTCIAALRYLGADYRLKNRLYTTGVTYGDTLVGNLILKTQFDTFFNRDTLNLMLKSVKTKGISYIKGDVIIDMPFIESMTHEQHWIIGDLRTQYMGLTLQGLPRMKREMAGALATKGIRIKDGKIRFGRLNPHTSTLIAENCNTLHGPVEKALKYSSNINAEALLYPLGYIMDKNGNYRENGKKLLYYFLKNELHVTPQAVSNIDDGCGLCPEDKLTPKVLVQLLTYTAHKQNIYREVIADLPLAGIDGTLYKRMHSPKIEGKLRGKTGTLTREGGISTLAGYFIGKGGHLIAYSIMNNNWAVADGRIWQDHFCESVFKPQKTM